MSDNSVSAPTPSGDPPLGVAIGGFMATGKSTLAPALARALGLACVDTDALLVAMHGPIDEQFRVDGEAAFRARERGVVRGLCDGIARVVATGGGMWADADNRARLAASYRTLVLTAPLSVIADRVARGSGRPLSGQLVELYEARRLAYADAELVIDTSRCTVDEALAEVLSWLGK